MGFVVWIAAGAVIGWIAGIIMRTDAQQGVLLNVGVGVVGAIVGGWLVSPMVGAASINQGDFSTLGLGVALLGAVLLLAIVNLFRSSKIR